MRPTVLFSSIRYSPVFYMFVPFFDRLLFAYSISFDVWRARNTPTSFQKHCHTINMLIGMEGLSLAHHSEKTGNRKIFSYIKTVFLSPKRSAMISMYKEKFQHIQHMFHVLFIWQRNQPDSKFHSRSIYSRCLFTLNGGSFFSLSLLFSPPIVAKCNSLVERKPKNTWKNETNSII